VKTLLSLPVLAALLLWVDPAFAQPGSGGADVLPGRHAPALEDQPRGASWRAQDSYVDFIHEPNGRVLLRIHYPWSAHARPSVEIRRLSDDEKDTGEIRSMGFAARVMKGDVTTAVYQCRNRSAETPVVRKLKRDGQEFEVVGAKNRLGSGSVCVVFPPQPDAKNPAVWAVYPLLADWAIDRDTLVLELPEPYFAEPGRIRVWFLREGEVLWWKTVPWPGRAERKVDSRR
jgi:hypothetical protein